MKFALPVTLVVVTVGLMVVALIGVDHAHGTVGIAAGSAMYGLTPKPITPKQALNNLLTEAQRRNWDRAFAAVSNLNSDDKASLSKTGRVPMAACVHSRIWKVSKRDPCTSPLTRRKCA